MRPQLSICIFLHSNQIAESLTRLLVNERYSVNSFTSEAEFLHFVESKKQQLDCLILEDDPAWQPVASHLRQEVIVLPAVIVDVSQPQINNDEMPANPTISAVEVAMSQRSAVVDEAVLSCFYHSAEVRVSTAQFNQITDFIHQALTEFLSLSPYGDLTRPATGGNSAATSLTQHLLLQQQRRLSEKLRERLGYLGVYYKRNPQGFLRHLPPAERREFLDSLKADYREIVLSYFSDDNNLNQKIDNFVNIAFFADVPVTNIVEIHMELMDDFAKQLKLEGRNEEILLDYRLTLIDTIAHLCEMYRRSLPQES